MALEWPQVWTDSCLNRLWYYAALLTYKNMAAAAAAAGLKDLLFGVPGRGACVGAAAYAGGEDDEGILYQPYGLSFPLQLPRLRRALSLGQNQEAFCRDGRRVVAFERFWRRWRQWWRFRFVGCHVVPAWSHAHRLGLSSTLALAVSA